MANIFWGAKGIVQIEYLKERKTKSLDERRFGSNEGIIATIDGYIANFPKLYLRDGIRY